MATMLEATEAAHVSTSDAATECGCSRQKILSLAARGLLAPVTVAGRVFFRRDEVRALAERLTAEATPLPRGRRTRSRA